MEVHSKLNKKIHFKKEYFSEWLLLFCSSVDKLFEGNIAELAKTRAKSIAAVMEFKMINAHKKMLG